MFSFSLSISSWVHPILNSESLPQLPVPSIFLFIIWFLSILEKKLFPGSTNHLSSLTVTKKHGYVFIEFFFQLEQFGLSVGVNEIIVFIYT